MVALDHLIGGADQELPERFVHQERRARPSFALAVASPGGHPNLQIELLRRLLATEVRSIAAVG